MAPSGPRTMAQVCTLEYCHPANGNKGPKQDNPQRESTGSAGKVAMEAEEEEEGSCEMLIELHPLIEVRGYKKIESTYPPIEAQQQQWSETWRKLFVWGATLVLKEYTVHRGFPPAPGH
ncbi:unnamed protein product [Pleuronectes platessa]|uniref:Uncharacterized protein n=1 Tax=Pleuronectes platessa TaxID=8262 RepID=A0A9N7ZBM1_PLEPL|nr:unnamed protein product [Pleuronectes platessa]